MLHGRDAERAQLASVLEAARRGRSGSVLVRGEPGIGRSALVEDVVSGSGLRMLRTQGLESEAPLAYAAEPLFPPHVWKLRTLVSSTTVMLGVTSILVGTVFLTSIFLQSVLGFSALRAGLAFLPPRWPSPPAPWWHAT